MRDVAPGIAAVCLLAAGAAACSDGGGVGPAGDAAGADADGGPPATDVADAQADGSPDGSGSAADGDASGGVPCTTGADCPGTAASPCREVRCVEEVCQEVALPDGTPCQPQAACTQGSGSCEEGECVGAVESCDDGNPCTTDACDPEHGCVHTFNQKPCDDGDPCTVGDRCFMGECEGEPLDCDDNNPCTEDSCDGEGGCVNEPRTGPCDDGNACTEGDECIDGECVPGEPLPCGEGNPCIEGNCDPAEGCSKTPIDGPCDDDDACTKNDTCKDGECVGDPVDCDDGNPCTDDFCDPDGGCGHENNQASCDDGDPCTLDDTCSGGTCQPGEVDPLCCDTDAGCDDGDPCTVDTCDMDAGGGEDGGYCVFEPKDCDDGHPCTKDACEGGTCTHEPYGALESGEVLSDGFEHDGALPDWSVDSSNPDVTWQADDDDARSGDYSLYCGNPSDYTYDYGQTQAEVTRELEVPPGDATLRMWIRQELGDPDNCSYDRTRILLNDEPVTPNECDSAEDCDLCDSISDWTEFTWDLSPWAGETVTLAIRFQTFDSINNEAEGPRVDDLAVVAESPENCCASDEDCSGSGCGAQVCDETSYECVPAESGEAGCDDGDPCTTDVCEDDGSCSHEPIEGCCTEAADCDDGDPCTEDSCGDDNTCSHEPIEGCCTEAADCDDGDPCTEDSCGDDDTCSHEPIEGCCTEASDCPDDPDLPCAEPVCEGNVCGFDTSACEPQ